MNGKQFFYSDNKSASWFFPSWTVILSGVYAFGFLFMLPQLFVNYKVSFFIDVHSLPKNEGVWSYRPEFVLLKSIIGKSESFTESTHLPIKNDPILQQFQPKQYLNSICHKTEQNGKHEKCCHKNYFSFKFGQINIGGKLLLLEAETGAWISQTPAKETWHETNGCSLIEIICSSFPEQLKSVAHLPWKAFMYKVRAEPVIYTPGTWMLLCLWVFH